LPTSKEISIRGGNFTTISGQSLLNSRRDPQRDQEGVSLRGISSNSLRGSHINLSNGGKGGIANRGLLRCRITMATGGLPRHRITLTRGLLG